MLIHQRWLLGDEIDKGLIHSLAHSAKFYNFRDHGEVKEDGIQRAEVEVEAFVSGLRGESRYMSVEPGLATFQVDYLSDDATMLHRHGGLRMYLGRLASS
jgi:hypothetical protein